MTLKRSPLDEQGIADPPPKRGLLGLPEEERAERLRQGESDQDQERIQDDEDERRDQ